MAKKPDYSPKEPGQQFEEIVDAQRNYRHQKHREQGDNEFEVGNNPPPIIDNIEKSKQRDKEELKQQGDEALERKRERIANQDEQRDKEKLKQQGNAALESKPEHNANQGDQRDKEELKQQGDET